MNYIHNAAANGGMDTAGIGKFGKRVAAIVTRIAEWIAEHNRRERDYQRLLEMPDHLLEDVGLTRGDIHAARHGHGIFQSHLH